MIHFNALGINECRSKSAISLFWRSVYYKLAPLFEKIAIGKCLWTMITNKLIVQFVYTIVRVDTQAKEYLN